MFENKKNLYYILAVREVYEHVYSTVDIQGSLDVRASATAKATVASFAASEGHVTLYSSN